MYQLLVFSLHSVTSFIGYRMIDTNHGPSCPVGEQCDDILIIQNIYPGDFYESRISYSILFLTSNFYLALV